jgi:hypothetical protein
MVALGGEAVGEAPGVPLLFDPMTNNRSANARNGWWCHSG